MSDVATPVDPSRPTPPGRVTQLRVAASEWTKLRSLRSTRWSLLVAVVLTIGLPMLLAAVIASQWDDLSPSEQLDQSPLDIALAGAALAQLAVAVLGVLVITGEYSTGMIRASFTAVPKRLPVLWAKAGVFAATVLALMVPSVLIAFFASQALLARDDLLQISLSDESVPRVIFGGAVYVTLAGVLALSIGAILRNTAGSISAFAALFFVVPPLMNLLPSNWNDAITPYLPSEAGQAMLATNNADGLSPVAGLALYVAYIALGLAVAAVLLLRRDA